MIHLLIIHARRVLKLIFKSHFLFTFMDIALFIVYFGKNNVIEQRFSGFVYRIRF